MRFIRIVASYLLCDGNSQAYWNCLFQSGNEALIYAQANKYGAGAVC